MATKLFKYTTNGGSTYNARDDADPAIDTIRGTYPTAPVTEPITLRKTRHSKEVGLRPRMVLFARLIGTDGTTNTGLTTSAKAYKKVIIPTAARWAAIVTGSIGGTGVDNFVHKGATYYATKLIDESRN